MIAVPVWTLVVRETKRVSAPRIDGITGTVVPLFTSEALADAACESLPGLDPVRIDHAETLAKMMRRARSEGCDFVAVDNVDGGGHLLPIGRAIL